MATANLKRKPRLSKIESYRAASTKEVQFRLNFVSCCSQIHTRLLLLVVLGGHVDCTLYS